MPSARTARLAAPVVHLLPNYDEQLIAYRHRSNAVDSGLTRKASAGIFDAHFVLIDGLLVGGWRRELTVSQVQVTARLLRQLNRTEAQALRAAAGRYASFLELELSLKLLK